MSDSDLTPAPHGGSAALRAQEEDVIGCSYCRDGDHFPVGYDYWICPECDAVWHDEPRGLSASEGPTSPEAVKS